MHIPGLRQDIPEQTGEAIGVRAEEDRVRSPRRIGAVDEQIVSQRGHPDAGLVSLRMRLEPARRFERREDFRRQAVCLEWEAPTQGVAEVLGHLVLALFQHQAMGRGRRCDETIAGLAQQLQQPHARGMLEGWRLRLRRLGW